MLRAYHGVCNDCRQQRLYTCKECDGNGIRELPADILEREHRNVHRDGRETGRNIGKLLADGVNVEVEDFYDNCSDDNRNKRTWDLLEEYGPYDQYDKRDRTYHDSLPVNGNCITYERHDLLAGLDGLLTVLIHDAGKILDLTDEEGNGNACRKAGRDRVGDVFEKASESADAPNDEDDTCHNGGDNKALRAVLHHDACNDSGKCRRRSRDLDSASAEERYDESCYDRSVDACFRAYTRCDGKSYGQRQSDYRYDYAGYDIFDELRT